MEKVNNNKPFFNGKEQKKVIADNTHLIEAFKKTKNITEWNIIREETRRKFKGTQQESAMLFGYIDGVIHPEIFGK